MKMKKFLAVVLSFALSVSLAMPTFAQDNTGCAVRSFGELRRNEGNCR